MGVVGVHRYDRVAVFGDRCRMIQPVADRPPQSLVERMFEDRHCDARIRAAAHNLRRPVPASVIDCHDVQRSVLRQLRQ